MSTFFKIIDSLNISTDNDVASASTQTQSTDDSQHSNGEASPTATAATELYKGIVSQALNFLWNVVSLIVSAYYAMRNFVLKTICFSHLVHNIAAGIESYTTTTNDYDSMSNEKFEYYQKKADLAETYDEWKHVASKLDQLEGYMDWMEDPQSNDYDWNLLQTRINDIVENRQSENDRKSMIFTLKLGQTRNLGDMGNSKLYSKTRVGTKQLISEYTDKVIEQLDWIGDIDVEDNDKNSNNDMSLKERHDYFMTLRQSYGRTALLLSGGGTLGFFHIGVMKALVNARLLPRIISGASTGSIMASIICTMNEEDRINFLNSPWSIPLDVFEDPRSPESSSKRLNRYRTEGNLYDPSFLKTLIRTRIGDITFQEAYNRSRLILNITVSSNSLFDMPRVLNYITAPDAVIWSAVMASCAVPLVYPSQEILIKSKSGELIPWTATVDKYRDGSIDNDLPLKKISELFSINHFVVVQLNPHVAPFLHKGHGEPSLLRTSIAFCLRMVKEEVQHRCKQLRELGIAPNGLRRLENVLVQRYLGDITVVPELSWKDVRNILVNPTLETVVDFTRRGERAAWQKMSKIEHSLKIELAIDAAIYRLRSKLLGESPQIPVEIPVNNDYIMTLSPSNSTSYLPLTPSISQQSMNSQSPCLLDYFQSTDDEEEEPRSASYLRKHVGTKRSDLPTSPLLPPTPLWEIENFETQLPAAGFFGENRGKKSRSNSLSTAVPINANLRRPSLLPHDISRRGSNVSIRDISPSTSTKFQRRKQITSAQFFISPEFEWAPKTTNQEFKDSISILAKKGAEIEAKAAAVATQKRNGNNNLSIHIPKKSKP